MRLYRPHAIAIAIVLSLACLSLPALAQDEATVLAGTDLVRVVPPGFYFQGLSAPTQRRNSAAVRFGANRFVIIGLVDTSGYAADIREKYEGFFITDSPISLNGSDVGTGAYGFGFTKDGKLNILDLAGNQLLSVSTTKDNQLRRPRPLMITKSAKGIRIYRGRDYAQIEPK
jgi:hypothetical protein